jgi:hypothetical protein
MSDLLESYTEPRPGFRYLARDGRYYNGYLLSPDAADDYFSNDECLRIKKSLESDQEIK